MKKLIIPLLLILLLPMFFNAFPLEILKLKTFDAFVKPQEPSGNFVILNITEADVSDRGGFPFPRQDYADIHVDLLKKGALGVGWVIAFSEHDRFGGDEQFASALNLSPSILAMFETNNDKFPKTSGTVYLGEGIPSSIKTLGVVENIDILKKSATQGIATAPVDIDNLVRRIPLLLQTPDGFVSAFGTEVLKTLTGAKTYIIKSNINGIEEITVQGIPPVKTDSLGRKWISWVDTPQTTLKEQDVFGKFVFVGVTANGVMPQIATPVGLLEPHKIQAALSESLLIQDSPYIPDWSLFAELSILIISSLLIWFSLFYFGITAGISISGVLFLATGFAGFYLIQKGILIDVTWSLIAQFVVAATAFYLRFREQYKLRQQIKKQFEHYLDPRQVKRLQDNPELLQLGGETKTATFLFTDVRGFTAMSEKLKPEDVTYIMNKVLTAQQKAVQKYGGMVDKYIGDAMMAIFNAPLDLQDHAKAAVDCAIEIIQNIEELATELQLERLPEIAIGIGINTGPAAIGNMGSETRFDYTAIGDAVNVAARLESATKERKVDLLISETTESLCGYNLKELEPVTVKGKVFPLKIYTYE
jgi:adenylate cyclase